MGLIGFCAIFAGTVIGYYLGRNLPQHHLDADSKDTIKMAWGTVATMSALVLSLLLASAKGSFDTVNTENTLAGTKIIVLDHILAKYGPETKAAREELRNDVSSIIQKVWPETHPSVPTASALEGGNGVERVQNELDQISPTNDTQRALLSQAQVLTGDLLQSRWLLVEQLRTGLPPTLFIVLVSWLTMLFIGLGLFAPRNKTVFIVLFFCNLSFSAALFMINEMNHPLDGIMKISSAPMLKALERLNQP